VFEDVAGIDLTDADTDLGFVELGLDSLTLTQAALQIKKTFKVSLTFRQLMENYRSLDALTAFLDQALPAEVAPAPEGARGRGLCRGRRPCGAGRPGAVTADRGGVGRLHRIATAGPAGHSAADATHGAATGAAPGRCGAGPGSGLPSAAAHLSTALAATSALPTAQPRSGQGAPAEADGADEANAARRYDVKKAFGAIARIHTQHSELTERQQARLQAFIQRYTERTARSKQYTEAHRAHLADPRVVNGFRPMTKEITYQIVIERSKGAHLWDLDGHEYVDVLNGFGMNLFGWQPDFVNDAVRRQLDLGYEIGPQHPLAGEVAQLVCELTGFDRAGLCNTGSEAVMAAVRIARTVTGRNTVVLFTGSYHGTFDEVLVRAGKAAKGCRQRPASCPACSGMCACWITARPRRWSSSARMPRTWRPCWWSRCRAVGRTSHRWISCARCAPSPRPAAPASSSTKSSPASGRTWGHPGHVRHPRGPRQLRQGDRGGFPIGVIAGKRDYMDALDGGSWQYGDESMPTVGVTYFAGTFVRHPLALAAAKAALQHLKDSGPALQEQLNRTTQALADDLNAYCKQVGAPVAVRHFASLWRVSWLEDHPCRICCSR
jgi:acyl carrier protein